MADAALVVVDAVAGVEVQTEKAWQAAEELEPAAAGRASTGWIATARRLDRTLESLRETLGRAVVPIQLPIGEEKHFTGVVDLVAMKAYTFPADGSSRMTEGPVPGRDGGRGSRPRARPWSRWSPKPTRALMEHFFEAGTLTAGRAR